MDIPATVSRFTKSFTESSLPDVRSGFRRSRHPGGQSHFLACAAAIFVAVVCAAVPVRAQVPDAYVVATQSYTTESFQGGQTLSITLHANQDVTFNSLGYIDANDNPNVDYHYFTAGDGLHGDYLVELILTSTQQVLASATVTPSSPLDQYSDFRYAPIPATTIQAGQNFTLAVVLPNTLLDPYLDGVTNTNDFGISGPVDVAAVNASTAVVAPEPTATTFLFLTFGGLAIRRHRRPAVV